MLCPALQLGSALINRDLRWHCERQYSLSLAGGLVDFFFLDTTPFVKKYRRRPWAKYTGSGGGRGSSGCAPRACGAFHLFHLEHGRSALHG